MRLIDADALKEWGEVVPLTDDGGIDINDFEERLASMPTIEAEPVTRCKDCIYYRQKIDTCDEPYSTAHNVVREDDYCSRAERKEKE